MDRISRIAKERRVRSALRAFHKQLAAELDLIVSIQQIASPTFLEERRASFVEAQFRALGLVDVAQDVLHNVFARLPGTGDGTSPPLVVSAHTDTVFPAETDLSVKRNGRYLYGPGIGDNSTGVAGLILTAQALLERQLAPPVDVWFVANVCEEGLGDLRGMYAVVDRFGPEAAYIVVEGGLFGQISHQAIGASRFQITVTGPGGHSWGSFGAPSAIHILARIVTAVDQISVPATPRTTYNVGTISGGTSINAIAQSASLQLDLRSEEVAALNKLVAEVEQIVQKVARSVQRQGVTIDMAQIGRRPAGAISRNDPLVALAAAALQHVGWDRVTFIKGSTDANVPLSRGITAVCIGLTESANAHRTDEYIDPVHLPDGLGQLLLLVLAAAGFDRVTR
jgi:acetylornithine deacetylase/succinyl-diaminopimelate desuccinylase-like protein